MVKRYSRKALYRRAKRLYRAPRTLSAGQIHQFSRTTNPFSSTQDATQSANLLGINAAGANLFTWTTGPTINFVNANNMITALNPQTTIASGCFGQLSLAFSLRMLGAATDFTNLFEQYKIVSITMTYRPLIGASNQNIPLATAGQNVGLLWWMVADHDDRDANVISMATLDAFRERAHIKTGTFNQVARCTMKPANKISQFTSAGTATTGVQSSQWITTSDLDVAHYGIKFAIYANSTTATQTYCWVPEMTMVVQCKNVQ